MERAPHRKILNLEKPPSVNYLREDLKVTFNFDPSAVDHLPTITESDLETKKERYRVLLGSVTAVSKDEVNVFIKGVFYMDDSNHKFYREGVEEVSDIKYNLYKKIFERDPKRR